MRNTLITAQTISGITLFEFFNRPIEAKTKESQSNIVAEAYFESDSMIW